MSLVALADRISPADCSLASALCTCCFCVCVTVCKPSWFFTCSRHGTPGSPHVCACHLTFAICRPGCCCTITWRDTLRTPLAQPTEVARLVVAYSACYPPQKKGRPPALALSESRSRSSLRSCWRGLAGPAVHPAVIRTADSEPKLLSEPAVRSRTNRTPTSKGPVPVGIPLQCCPVLGTKGITRMQL